jgi:methylmalonyl-CoA/ethylmalonyl-CoA epimerase
LSPIRRLDHIAVVVRDTEAALVFFRDCLGLQVTRTEEVMPARVRLTYLDLGNAFLQLVEPLDDQAPISGYLEQHGEGIHHIGLAVDDVIDDVTSLTPDESYAMGSGRGRRAVFLPGSAPHNVRIELTDFDFDQDVVATEGWLARE